MLHIYIYFIKKLADIIFKGVVRPFQNKVKQIVNVYIFHIHCKKIDQILVLFIMPFSNLFMTRLVPLV